MKWIRITMKGKAFAHPTMCPNCLDEPATTPVHIVRDALMPGFIVSYEGDWPHCEACAFYYQERSRHFTPSMPRRSSTPTGRRPRSDTTSSA